MAKLKKRTDGRYQATVRYQGKRYTVYAKSPSELIKKKAEKLAELEGKSCERSNPTLNQYYETFTELRRGNTKESTIRVQRSSFRRCADTVIDANGTMLGTLNMQDITPKDCQIVQKALIQSGSSTRTVNDLMNHLSHVFNAAVRDETINRNPCQCIEQLKRTEEPVKNTIHRALTREETTMFFQTAANSYYINAYKLMIQTGMRIGEVCALYPSDIDIDNNCIHVTKTITRDETGGYIVGRSTKTNSGFRDIPLNSIILDITTAQRHHNGRIFSTSDLLFPSAEGKILREYTVNRDIKRICQKCDIKPFTCHAFRATFATRFIEQRPQDYKILSDILGHATTKITLDLYTHAMQDTKNNAMSNISILM